MRLNEETMRKLVASHDETQILRALSNLRGRLQRESTLLRQQADIAANLRHAYMETELDRDRLQHMAKALYGMCESHGLSQEAEEIAERFGGISGPGDAKIVG